MSGFTNSEENEARCPACLEDLMKNEINTISLLDFSHKFHYTCIIGWFEHSKKTWCPLCRVNTTSLTNPLGEELPMPSREILRLESWISSDEPNPENEEEEDDMACTECGEQIFEQDDRILCSECNRWTHRRHFDDEALNQLLSWGLCSRCIARGNHYLCLECNYAFKSCCAGCDREADAFGVLPLRRALWDEH